MGTVPEKMESSCSLLVHRFRHDAPRAREERDGIGDLVWWTKEPTNQLHSREMEDQMLDHKIQSVIYEDSKYMASKLAVLKRSMNESSSIKNKNGDQISEPAVNESPSFKVASRLGKKVEVLWDVENIQIRKREVVVNVVKAIRFQAIKLAKAHWGEAEISVHIKCFHYPLDSRGTLTQSQRNSLATAQVTLIDIGKRKPGQADLLILQSIGDIETNSDPRCTMLILISNDSDYINAVTRLNTLSIPVVSIQRNTSIPTDALLVYSNICTKVLDWEEEIISHSGDRIKPLQNQKKKMKKTSSQRVQKTVPIPEPAIQNLDLVEVSISDIDSTSIQNTAIAKPDIVDTARLGLYSTGIQTDNNEAIIQKPVYKNEGLSEVTIPDAASTRIQTVEMCMKKPVIQKPCRAEMATSDCTIIQKPVFKNEGLSEVTIPDTVSTSIQTDTIEMCFQKLDISELDVTTQATAINEIAIQTENPGIHDVEKLVLELRQELINKLTRSSYNNKMWLPSTHEMEQQQVRKFGFGFHC